MTERRPNRSRRGGTLAATLLVAGCADVLGLDLDGWQYGEPSAGRAGAGTPPLEAGRGGGPSGRAGGASASASAGAGAGGAGGGGSAGAPSPPAASCDGMPDRRDGTCCAAVTACSPGETDPVCAPARFWDHFDSNDLGGISIPLQFAEPYEICKDFTCLYSRVNNTLAYLCALTGGSYCIEDFSFHPEISPRLTVVTKPGACYAEGLDGPNPKVYLDPDTGSGCDEAAYRHVFGHVLGLAHTHQRADRDRYLDVDRSVVPCGCEGDVLRTCGPDEPPAGPFDYESMMMYPTAAPAAPFFTDKQGTLLPRSPQSLGPHDMPSVIERARRRAGWQPSAMLGHDTGPLAPLATGLPEGQYLDGAPAVVLERAAPPLAEDRLHLFARSSRKRLYEKISPAPWTSGPAPRPDYSATPWVEIGAQVVSDVAAAALPGGGVHVVARHEDGGFFYRKLGADDTLPPPSQPPPGSLLAPALSAWGDDRLALVTLGADGAYWLLTFEGGAWGTTWKSLGSPGVEGFAPVVASWGPDRLDVVGKRLYGSAHRVRDPSCPVENDYWCDWAEFYTPQTVYAFPGTGTLIAPAPGVLDFFYTALEDSTTYTPLLWHSHYEGGEWGFPVVIGGSLAAGPAAVAWPDGAQTLFGTYLTSFEGSSTGARTPMPFERTWRRPEARAR